MNGRKSLILRQEKTMIKMLVALMRLCLFNSFSKKSLTNHCKCSVETGNIGVIHTVTHKREKKNAYGRVSSASSQSFCNKNFANFTWVALAHYLIVFLAVNGCSISAHGVSAPGNDAFLIERQTCIETSDILTHCRELKMINSLSVQKGTQFCNRGTKWRMKMA